MQMRVQSLMLGAAVIADLQKKKRLEARQQELGLCYERQVRDLTGKLPGLGDSKCEHTAEFVSNTLTPELASAKDWNPEREALSAILISHSALLMPLYRRLRLARNTALEEDDVREPANQAEWTQWIDELIDVDGVWECPERGCENGGLLDLGDAMKHLILCHNGTTVYLRLITPGIVRNILSTLGINLATTRLRDIGISSIQCVGCDPRIAPFVNLPVAVSPSLTGRHGPHLIPSLCPFRSGMRIGTQSGTVLLRLEPRRSPSTQDTEWVNPWSVWSKMNRTERGQRSHGTISSEKLGRKEESTCARCALPAIHPR